MKVAFVVHDCREGGGHERFSAELLRRIAPRHEVHLFACGYQDLGAPIAAYHRIRAIERPNIVKVLLFLAQTYRLNRAGPFDLVHTHGLCFRTANVVTAHACQAARCALRDTPAGGARGAYQRAYLAWTAALERRFLYGRPRVTVLAVSEKVRRDLLRHYGCVPERVRVVYPGVDGQRFAPDAARRRAVRDALGLAPEETAALFVGTPAKGLDTLLEALRPVAAEERIRLLVVGSGDPALYLRPIRRFRAEGFTRFLGHQKEIAALYAASDLFVFPSRYDTFGMAALEAMAAGLPTIVSVEAGVHEIVRDGIDGLHLPDPRDPARLRETVLALVRDPERRAELGRAARERALQFTWDETARRTLEAYETAVA